MSARWLPGWTVLGVLLIAPCQATEPAEPTLLDERRPTVSTLEDIYGPTGKRFQAAIGLVNFEKVNQADPDPKTGYGIGVDDVVFTWKEIHLV